MSGTRPFKALRMLVTASNTYRSLSMSGTANWSTAASSRTCLAKRGPSPSANVRPRPMASGTVRMSLNRMAASSGKRSSGCRVTSVA
ncbi:hypothetical protein D3C87_1584650 [compost metagenome]